MKKISDRVRAVLDEKIREYKRAATLNEMSGIATETWKKFLAGKQNATLQMIEWICETWPTYAFWIATGITDSRHGHIGPDVTYGKNSVNRKRRLRRFSEPYFKWKIAVLHGETSKIDWDKLVDTEPSRMPIQRIQETNQSWDYKKQYLEWKNADETLRERIDLEHLMSNDELICAAQDAYLWYSDPQEEERFRQKVLSGELHDGSKKQ